MMGFQKGKIGKDRCSKKGNIGKDGQRHMMKMSRDAKLAAVLIACPK